MDERVKANTAAYNLLRAREGLWTVWIQFLRQYGAHPTMWSEDP